VNSGQIARELKKVYERQRAGIISSSHAKEELAILVAMLKAYELAVLEKKYDKLEAILESRNV
jgi:hypothetical protein